MMVATLPRLLQLMTSSLRLAAVLAVPADGSFQVFLSFVNPPLASTIVVTVVRPSGNRASEKTESDERGE